MAHSPQLIILAGPNGAGKTTAAKGLLQDYLQLGEFVNADTIAAGLAGFAPERAAFAAGRIMLQRLHELAASRANFAFETTMASRTLAPWVRGLVADGYRVQLAFFWLRSPQLAAKRVRARVRAGGHDIPPPTIERRYWRGLHNFVHLYAPLVHAWTLYDNSATMAPKAIASRQELSPIMMHDQAAYQRFLRSIEISEQRDHDTFA